MMKKFCILSLLSVVLCAPGLAPAGGGKGPMVAPMPGHGAMGDAAEGKLWHMPGAVKAPAELDFSDLEKPEGAKTVAEIFDGRAELAGKEVTIRAKVVKVNSKIMGHNWLHLRDGTTSKDGENDLTVTSDAMAEVGDTVLVKGKLAVDRDFGFNYRYAVMLEEATVEQ